MARCEFFKVCQLHRNHKGNGNVPMVIFSLLSRFKLCFVETQVFLTISCNKISSLFKTRISVNESNFPDLLLARILKTRLISLIAFSIFTILLCLKSFHRKVLSITPHRKRIKEIGLSWMCQFAGYTFLWKKTKRCFEEAHLFRRSYVTTYHVLQRDVFHAAN